MSDQLPVVIKVEDVVKVFRLPNEKNSSIKSALVHFYRRRGYKLQKALGGVSFEIKQGEFFGIVGRNGSGKSTMLKLLAGIYQPTSGRISVAGKLTPFIELGVGFNPELSGRDNIYLNGALLGFSRSEMREMYPDIVGFSELSRFMDQKLKNYSSGMQVRLAFSIAIRAKTDILLIDEVLAVGDANFQQKCYNYFAEVKEQGKTVVFVSHDMEAVRNFCDRAILLENGKIVAEGSSYQVTGKYTDLNLKSLESFSKKVKTDSRYGESGAGGATITRVWTSHNDQEQTVFRPNQKMQFNIEFSVEKKLKEPVVGLSIQDAQERVIYATHSNEHGVRLKDGEPGQKAVATFEVDNLFTNGRYFISCAVANTSRTIMYSRLEKAHSFMIGGFNSPHSLTHVPANFTIKY